MNLDGFSLRCGSSPFMVGLTKHLVHRPQSACCLSYPVCSCSAGQPIECEEVQCDEDDCPGPIEQCPEEDPSLNGFFPYCKESFFGCQYGEVECCPGQDPTPARSECPFKLLCFILTVDSFFVKNLPCGINVSHCFVTIALAALSHCLCCYHCRHSYFEACSCTKGKAIQCTDQTSCASVLCPFDPLGPSDLTVDPGSPVVGKTPPTCPEFNLKEIESFPKCTKDIENCPWFTVNQCCPGIPVFHFGSEYRFVRQLFALDSECHEYPKCLTSNRFSSSILPIEPAVLHLPVVQTVFALERIGSARIRVLRFPVPEIRYVWLKSRYNR